jgi:hypothetical protein
MMTTSDEHEPTGFSQDSTEAWRMTMALARYERRQRGERYMARHRSTPDDGAEGHDTSQRSA